MKKLILPFICLFLAIPCQAKIITVDDDGPADFNNIQAAINDSNDGDTILVADGRYTGEGNRDINFFGKAITVRSENGPQNCIVDSEGAWLDSHRAFYFHCVEGPSSVLDGLTISGGHVYNESGGGILSLSSSPTIRDCIIRNNYAEFAMIGGGFGGGIALGDSNSLILNCTVINNGAGAGGGIYCGRGSPTISNCLISSNGRSGIECYQCSAKISRCIIEENSGGGIVCRASTEIAFCAITGNYSYGSPGGGIACEGNSIIRNCLISNNAAYYAGHSTSGGGVWCGEHSNPIIINCTIAHNHADGYGGGIGCYFADPTVINTILWGNSAQYSGPQVSLRHTGWPSSLTISFSNVQGGTEGIYMSPECILLWGEGNIEGDPNFADPNNGNYHLKSQAERWDANEGRWTRDDVTSPCIDAGDPMGPIGFEPFPNGGRINIGAYGGTAEASKSYFGKPVCETIVAGDINGDCTVNFKDFALMALHWLECIEPNQGRWHLVEDDTEDSYSCEGNFDVSFHCSNAVDEDWDTYALPADAGAPSIIYENYIIPAGMAMADFTIKYRQTAPVTPGLCTNVTDYWDGSTWKELNCTALTTQISTLTVRIPDDALSGSTLQLRTRIWKSLGVPGSGSGMYYEGKVIWYLLPVCQTIVAGDKTANEK